MRIVFLSHMFPNSVFPLSVPFMVGRAKAISQITETEIIAPVSSFPLIKRKLPALIELFDGLEVKHPRYLALPLFLWSFRWIPYLNMLRKIWGSLDLQFDILHIEWIYPDAYAVVRYAKKKGVKIVGVVHGNEAIDYFSSKSRRKKYIEVFSALDKIIVVSDDLKKKLIKEYCVDARKISIILNGVDINKFPTGNKINAREKLGMSIKSSIGVCVARLSEEKNLNILIQAVAKLKEKSPFIYIIGDGPLKDDLQKIIYHCGVDKRVKLLGPMPHDQIYWWLNASDFFCLPSQREGCPVVIHEALACGVPVISTTVGAIPDLIKDDRFGFLCEPDSVSEFTAIMKKAMSKKWDKEIISAYG
ncbi:MAG: glycosyltransferase, partial [Anaerolineaceae bacterium]|nr:glycosyltransferase [Anaerolineaceae bacterium]